MVNNEIFSLFLDLSSTAVSSVLGEHTNVELRRFFAKFLTHVINDQPELDSITAKPLIHGFQQTDHHMIIDAVAIALRDSKYLERITDPEKLAIHDRLKGMPRPGLNYLKFAAGV